MKLQIKYISWRQGRPRFQPSASMRSRGQRGEDLRHPGGQWFNAVEAKAYSDQKVAAEILRRGPKGTPKLRGRQPGTGPEYKRGYVYFLRSGDRIKIGFSANPSVRIATLKTGTAQGVHSVVIVQGSEWHEKRAHRLLNSHRRNGEWFEVHPDVISMMLRSATEGTVSLS